MGMTSSLLNYLIMCTGSKEVVFSIQSVFPFLRVRGLAKIKDKFYGEDTSYGKDKKKTNCKL